MLGIPDNRDASGGVSRKLSIGKAILIGEVVVVLPSIAVLLGTIAGLIPLLQQVVGYDGTGASPALPSILGVIAAFILMWAWWALFAPHWLLWAMKRVDDPLLL